MCGVAFWFGKLGKRVKERLDPWRIEWKLLRRWSKEAASCPNVQGHHFRTSSRCTMGGNCDG